MVSGQRGDRRADRERSVRLSGPMLVAAAAVALAVVGLAALLIGRSEPEPEIGFTVDNREGFMTACTRPLEDTQLTSGICQCVIDEIVDEDRLTVERFEAIDQRLVEMPEAELPADLVAIVAECVIDQAEL